MEVRLGSFTQARAERTLRWVNDPELMMTMNRAEPVTESRHKKWFENIKRQAKIFAIIAEGEHIGNCCLFNINCDRRSRKADLWIYIGEKSCRGRGVGQKAMTLLLDFAFRRLKLHKVCLYVMVYNVRAYRMYKKLGFRDEGRKIKHVFLNGKFYDTIDMGILAKDWKRCRPACK